MTLNLIREAHIKASLTGEERQLMETVKKVLGKDSLASLVEAYRPSATDYKKWLSVVRGYARDNNVKISNKGDFTELVGAVLENDPTPPPYSMQQSIMDKLWLMHQARKHDQAIDKLAQAAEDEERVAYAARTMVDDGSYEDEEFEDQLDGTTPEEEIDDAIIRDDRPSSDGDDEIPWWDAEDDTDQAAFPKYAERTYGGQGNEDPFDTTPEEDTFDPGAEGDEFPEDEMGNEFLDDEMGNEPSLPTRSRQTENEEVAPAPKQMTVLQHMLTLPKVAVNTLVKDIEAEGGAAWKQHQRPQNPHPKDSMAYKAWERGMNKAIKDQLGLNDKPTTKPAKRKTTKR